VSVVITGQPPLMAVETTRRGREIERTADGHHVVVDGRRWRATDPLIPEPDAAVLRRWLAAARRDVGAARRRARAESDAPEVTGRNGDAAPGTPAADEAAARSRVHAAKTALGERGPAWWEQSDDERRARWRAGLDRAAAEGITAGAGGAVAG